MICLSVCLYYIKMINYSYIQWLNQNSLGPGILLNVEGPLLKFSPGQKFLSRAPIFNGRLLMLSKIRLNEFFCEKSGKDLRERNKI